MILIPKNWAEFQHYKDRRPPWIKLHRSLLDDRSFMSLPIDSKALAPLLWLLASEEQDGKFNADADELSFRLRMTIDDINNGLKPLLDKGFFVDASTMLAPCLTVAVPETETETETKTKTEKSRAVKPKKSSIEKPESVTDQMWSDFLTHRKNKKANVTQTVLNTFIEQSELAGWTLEAAFKECINRGWTGFKAEWVNKDSKKEGQFDYT